MIHRDKPKRLRFAAIAVAIAVLAGGGYALLYEKPPPLQGMPLDSLKQPSPMFDPSTPVVAQAPTPTPAQTPTPSATPRQVAPGAADAEFKRLASPQATYAERRKAYAMAVVCMREFGPYGVRLIMRPCELAPGTWQDAEVRKRLITECAEKGDCWHEMFDQGPKGHYPVFSEVEYAPLEKKALTKAVEKGDPFALTYEARALRDKAKQQQGDEARATLTKALSYEIASAAGIAYLNGMPFNAKDDPNLQRALPFYASALTQEDANAATTEARRLVGVFKKSREQS